jgi:hypothetical protein
MCEVYQHAPELEAKGTHVVSSDEKTGIQALERAAPTRPTRPGLDERREFEYIRRGTLCLMANLLTRGVPITVVSELLGHSDINLTVKRYGRFASDAKIKWDAVSVLDPPGGAAPAPTPAKRRLTLVAGAQTSENRE